MARIVHEIAKARMGESLALFARMPEARADSRRLKDDANAATQQHGGIISARGMDKSDWDIGRVWFTDPVQMANARMAACHR